jgi:PadR family transcriptional regulator AphA
MAYIYGKVHFVSKENKSRYALLGMLSLQPMSGYDLKKFIEGSTANFWQENYAQIYPILRQLTAEGLTTCHAEKQEKRPERRVYELTEKGWDELRRWLTEPFELQIERNELLLKLFFARHALPAVSVAHVRRFRLLQTQLLQRYAEIAASLKERLPGHEDLPYWLMTLNYGKQMAQARLAWCDETLSTLEKLAGVEQTAS